MIGVSADPDNGTCEQCGLILDGGLVYHDCECQTCEEPGCDARITTEEVEERDAALCEEHSVHWADNE